MLSVNRIKYMKDFTGEGRIYFNPGAKVTFKEPTQNEIPAGVNKDEVLVANAQYLEPVILPQSVPVRR